MNINNKSIGFNKNIKKHGSIFHYDIISDPFLSISYVSVRMIPCSCLECLRKLYFPWNISQDKYNQEQYKGENQNYFHWPILGS